MKKIASFSIIAVLTALFAGCDKVPAVKSAFDKYALGKQKIVETIVHNYDIVVIVDGTDRIHNEYAVPIVTMDYITTLAEKIQQNGQGRLWLGYVDNNSENNNIAYLEIFQAPRPIEITEKKRSETVSEYNERLTTETERFAKDSVEFEKNKKQRLSDFSKEAQEIIRIAYSDKVATAKVGSDVNGAINAGNRLLKMLPNNSVSHQYLVLVSDGVDNIKKPLNEIPENVKVLLINNSGSKSHLENKVVELDNFSRMEEYIFNK